MSAVINISDCLKYLVPQMDFLWDSDTVVCRTSKLRSTNFRNKYKKPFSKAVYKDE